MNFFSSYLNTINPSFCIDETNVLENSKNSITDPPFLCISTKNSSLLFASISPYILISTIKGFVLEKLLACSGSGFLLLHLILYELEVIFHSYAFYSNIFKSSCVK